MQSLLSLLEADPNFRERIYITKGLLTRWFEPYDLPGADIMKWHQVYTQDGKKYTGDWEGRGHVGDRLPNGRVLLLLASSSAMILEMSFDSEPTPESADYEAGYRKGFTAKRKLSKLPAGVSDAWHDGYAAGIREKNGGALLGR